MSFRREHRELFPALRRETDCTETGAAVALALALAPADRWTHYPRNKERFRPRWRYHDPLQTYAGVVGAMDQFGRQGLIDNVIAPIGLSGGLQSTARAKPALIAMVTDVIGAGTRPPLRRLLQPIELRDASKYPINYDDSPGRRKMRNKIREFNDVLRSVQMSMTFEGQLVRIFNEGFDRGGRFYVPGGGWQCLASDERAMLTLGGEPVVELDYSAQHPVICYNWVGRRPPDDCYAVKGWPRGLIKAVVLRIINARNWYSARDAIAFCDAMAGIDRDGRFSPDDFVAVSGSAESRVAAAMLMHEIQKFHRPISEFFFSGAGAKLMRLDSDMSEIVLSEMLSAGIPCLPVHDSFIVPASKSEILRNSMNYAAEKMGIFHLEIRAK